MGTIDVVINREEYICFTKLVKISILGSSILRSIGRQVTQWCPARDTSHLLGNGTEEMEEEECCPPGAYILRRNHLGSRGDRRASCPTLHMSIEERGLPLVLPWTHSFEGIFQIPSPPQCTCFSACLLRLNWSGLLLSFRPARTQSGPGLCLCSYSLW